MPPTTDETIQPLKDELTAITPEDTMAEAGRKALLKDFIQFREYELTLADDAEIEAIHKMRVATRRMRSVFTLLGDYYKSKPVRPFEQHLKKLGKRLGKVRDIDVMTLNLTHYQQSGDAEGFAKQLTKLNKQRGKALKQLHKFISGDDHSAFIERFTKFLTTEGKSARKVETDVAVPYQVRHVLPMVVQEHLATIKAYDNVVADADVNTLHALRIEFKQLRYLITHFQDVLGASSSSFIDDLVKIQDYLGELNDMVVAQDHFNKVIDNKKLSKADRHALKTYVTTLADDQQDVINNFANIWDKFNTRTVQRRLVDALLVLR